MLGKRDLRERLNRIDGQGYRAYRDIAGEYDFGEYTLFIDRVQGDPFASPSRLRVRVYQNTAGFPKDTYGGRSRRIALRDFITRAFDRAVSRFAMGSRGSGRSGQISIDRPGQEILERSSADVTHMFVEVRITAGLPAFGRTVAGKHAEAMFFEELPKIVRFSMLFDSQDRDELYRHIETAEDADFLRNELELLGLAAFVSDGSVLPRASGADQRPLESDKVVRFMSPPTLKTEVELPNSGQISGMGIPKGVTLIVGGGYHGKSTLLKAIERGVYNHIPGDGREYVVTVPNAVKIRAEDGRRVEKVNISEFISGLPDDADTKTFSTDNASGSTSQAANIIEAIETGTDALLIDEDTSAGNFMIRDRAMRELLPADKEPIRPFIERVRSIYTGRGISTILVTGGSGEYFTVADHVICMIDYKAYDKTREARGIAESLGHGASDGGYFGAVTDRIPDSGSFDPSKGRRNVKITAKKSHTINYGRHEIDLRAVEQLVSPSQTNAIADAIEYARKYMDGVKTLREVCGLVMLDLEREGFGILNGKRPGQYAEFRTLELSAAINRLRTLRVTQK